MIITRSWFARLVFTVTATLCIADVVAAEEKNSVPDAPGIVQFLDQTINWARQRSQQRQIATEPSDLVELADTRQLADQIVRLSFEFARAAAAMIERNNPAATTGGTQEFQSLTQLQSRLDKQIRDIQNEIDTVREKLAAAARWNRPMLQAQVTELQAEMDLANARRDAVHGMVEFVSSSNATGLGNGLRAQIETLAGSVAATTTVTPTSTSSTQPATPSTTNVPIVPASKVDPSSIWDLGVLVVSLSQKVRRIDEQRHETQALQDEVKDISAPFIAQLVALSQQGDQLAAEADAADQNRLAQERTRLDALAAQFKQFSAASLPLSKETVLLGFYQSSLARWRQNVSSEYRDELQTLGLRVGILAVILTAVFALSALWKRVVYRYIHEPRRRYQFLLLRRFVLWFVVAIVIGVAFVSRVDSFVTFAGLLTAGIAVALQNVIVSFVGYFFLIGKHGIRVGDRVQIGAVSGEVIDIGLVRLHLMELHSGLSGPTGRVVAFSNSIVFQSSAGLFKQLPGINFAWHEITMMLAADTDFVALRERLMNAVQAVLANYKEEIERQNREIERTSISVSGNGLQPHIRLRYMSTGIEASVRYPVDLQHATEIDERVSQELLAALDREPKFKLASSGLPDMKLRTEIDAP